MEQQAYEDAGRVRMPEGARLEIGFKPPKAGRVKRERCKRR